MIVLTVEQLERFPLYVHTCSCAKIPLFYGPWLQTLPGRLENGRRPPLPICTVRGGEVPDRSVSH